MIALALLLQAGPVQVSGRAVRIVDTDTVPAAAAAVVLHRVGAEQQGAVDSALTTADGRFSFTFTPDSGDVLLVSARWGGVDYFGPPALPGTTMVVLVADTSSTVPVTVAARHVIIGGRAPDGSRDVVDLVVLRNEGNQTRVPGADAEGSWQMLLPPLIANATVGDGDFAAEAFDLHGDSLHLLAPIPPGDRQFFLQYQLAPGAKSLRLVLDPTTDTITVLGEESDLKLSAGLVRAGTESMAGRSFNRWSGGRVSSPVVVTFPDADGPAPWLLPALLLLLGAPLAWLTWRAVGRR